MEESNNHKASKTLIEQIAGFLKLKNTGWILIIILLILLLIGFLNDLIFNPPKGSIVDPIIWILDVFFKLLGYENLQDFDYRAPTILRNLSNGAVTTLIASVLSVSIGFFLAVLFAVILVTPGKVLGFKYVAQAYVDFFRSTPLLVQILLVYFGLPAVFPDLIPFIRSLDILNYEIFSGTIALALNTAAYQSEIIRSGILAIPTGQTEAARALGLTSKQTMRYVILPQAIRLIVPPLTNEAINVLLNSSLISAIGAVDLTKSAQSMQAYYFLWQIFFIAAIYYFVIAYTLSKLTKEFEVRFRIPGLGVAHD